MSGWFVWSKETCPICSEEKRFLMDYEGVDMCKNCYWELVELEEKKEKELYNKKIQSLIRKKKEAGK